MYIAEPEIRFLLKLLLLVFSQSFTEKTKCLEEPSKDCSYTLISLFQVQSKEAETFQIFRASSTWLFTEAYLGPVN